VTGLLLALLATVRVPARVPDAVGVNATLTVHELPTATVEQVLVWLKSPVTATFETAAAVVPELVTVTVWAGVYPGNVDLGVPIFYMYSKELSVHSVKLAPYSFPRALEILPKLDLKPMITVFPLDNAVQAFEEHKKGKAIKILLKP
jgi:threonine dehydrogenase-like Zn-dependent dehydrogenase